MTITFFSKVILILRVLTIIINLVIIIGSFLTLTNNSFRMGPKRPNSTPLSGKTTTDNVTQGDQGRGQAGEHPAVFTQRSGRQGAPTDQGQQLKGAAKNQAQIQQGKPWGPQVDHQPHRAQL